VHLKHPAEAPSGAEIYAATRTQTLHCAAERLRGQRHFSWIWAMPLRQLCAGYLKIQPHLLYIKISLLIDFQAKLEAFAVNQASTGKV